jgi:hypothetical protein
MVLPDIAKQPDQMPGCYINSCVAEESHQEGTGLLWMVSFVDVGGDVVAV